VRILAGKVGEPGFDRAFDLCLLAALLLLALLICVAVIIERRERKKRRGFEVKPSAGEAPVIEKKENDHG
jgi:hypothetical protein